SMALSAQFRDDFTDIDLADFWQGDRNVFRIVDGRLQLNDMTASGSRTSTLYALAPTSTQATTRWQIQVENTFSPSTSNYTRIYLATDRPPTAADNFNGYYLQVGGISGDQDALELYRQDGASRSLLIRGAAGAVSANPKLSILVVRSPSGTWTLETDYTGGEDYDVQGMATDFTYPEAQYFGLGCVYTSTRSDAFFFDNILIDPIIVDDTPPTVRSVSAEGPASLRVQFSEAVQLDAAVFSVDQGIGTATATRPLMNDASTWLIDFDNPFTNFVEYRLTATAVDDLSGNRLSSQTLPFIYILPEAPLPGDLVLTEIFPDPTPPVGLPDFEYVELWNR
ncbi:MAG: hypothetical protein D6772_13750, partial [Bacteroidetes bacterium]